MSVEILLPALSPTMESGKIVNWHKKIGDSIKSGDVVFEVETDKAVMEVESSDDGVLACILVKEGECKVGEVVAVIATKNEDVSTIAQKYEIKGTSVDHNENILPKLEVPIVQNVVTKSDESQLIKPKSSNVLQDDDSESNIKKISPLAKVTAFSAGISREELFEIHGSGQENRVVKKDINKFLSHQTSADSVRYNSNSNPNPNLKTESTEKESTQVFNLANKSNNSQSSSSEFNVVLAKNTMNTDVVIEQPSKMRQSIAQSLTKAVNEIPTFSMSQQCVMDKAMNFIKEAREVSGVRISLNDLIIKACAFAINQVRVFNNLWKNGQITKYNSIDVGFAVAVNSGVVVRILRNALHKNLVEIALETKSISEETREKNIHEDYVFCISNMGGSGVESFVATLSGTAIFAVGSCYKAPVVENDELQIRNVMNVCITCDHRLIDGIDAANWMKFFKIAISNPSMILLG